VFLSLNLFSFPSINSNSSLNKNSNTDFSLLSPRGQTYFSSYVDNNTGSANIYTANSYYDSLVLNSFSIMNDQLESSEALSLSVMQLLGDYGYVQYTNYFISNDSKFVILRTYLYPINTFTILSLDTNNSISFDSDTSAYYLSLITRFSNSPDVFFCLNNDTDYLIIKFSFTNNNF
jgi:hypothetical protein